MKSIENFYGLIFERQSNGNVDVFQSLKIQYFTYMHVCDKGETSFATEK